MEMLKLISVIASYGSNRLKRSDFVGVSHYTYRQFGSILVFAIAEELIGRCPEIYLIRLQVTRQFRGSDISLLARFDSRQIGVVNTYKCYVLGRVNRAAVEIGSKRTAIYIRQGTLIIQIIAPTPTSYHT